MCNRKYEVNRVNSSTNSKCGNTKSVEVCEFGEQARVCWKSTNTSWGRGLCLRAMIYFFSIIRAAYVGLIYIHGYPDNEAFNPGDPAVRTMNPITSCRLRDGMADSETDGRGCGRPAIQSHLSHSPVSSPPPFPTILRSCSHRNLSTGQGQSPRISM